MKALFLSAWYPNRYDEMAGLFVRKHAQAVSLFCEVEVLYVHPTPGIKQFETEIKQIENVKETTVYFPANSDNLINKVLKQINYLRAYRQGWKTIRQNGFTPDIVHANILTRTGFMAYIIKRLTGIPYVVTEHWSRYLPERKAFENLPDKWITKKIVASASAILPVSKSLKDGMISHQLYNNSYHIINNVVDNHFFKNSIISPDIKKRILHVSCFDESAKNIKGLLRAVKQLSEKRSDFEFIVVGNGIDYDEITEYCTKLDFPEKLVCFTGELTPDQVASEFAKASVFVLFSNYETAGVVLAESLVSGVPVVSSEVGIALEYVDATNGALVDCGDEKSLTESLDSVLNNLASFNRDEIREHFCNTFSYQTIGKKIISIYSGVMKNDK